MVMVVVLELGFGVVEGKCDAWVCFLKKTGSQKQSARGI
jgi:hypothetical protein